MSASSPARATLDADSDGGSPSALDTTVVQDRADIPEQVRQTLNQQHSDDDDDSLFGDDLDESAIHPSTNSSHYQQQQQVSENALNSSASKTRVVRAVERESISEDMFPHDAAKRAVARFPPTVGVESRPFDPTVFREMLPRYRDSRNETIHTDDIIRWRYAAGSGPDSEEPRIESNARLVEWTNGEYSLFIGELEFTVGVRDRRNVPDPSLLVLAPSDKRAESDVFVSQGIVEARMQISYPADRKPRKRKTGLSEKDSRTATVLNKMEGVKSSSSTQGSGSGSGVGSQRNRSMVPSSLLEDRAQDMSLQRAKQGMGEVRYVQKPKRRQLDDEDEDEDVEVDDDFLEEEDVSPAAKRQRRT
jgi:hypothetical protein